MPMDDDKGRGRTSAGYQGQGRGSGVTDARPSPGGGNTGGGSDRDRQNDSNRDKQRAADDDRARATQEAVDRDKRLAAITEGMRQSELQRVAAGIASLRGVPLPQVQEARVTPGQARFKRDVDLDAAYDAVQAGLTMQGSGAMSPPVSPVAPTTTLTNVPGGSEAPPSGKAPANDYLSKIPYTKSDVNAIADQLSKAYGIDPRLVKAQLMNESGMNPFPKTGSAGEIGPGQIKPSTFKDPGYGVTPGTGDITNPYTNIDFQIRYLIGRGAKGDVANLNTDEGIREALEEYNAGSNKSKYASDIMGSMGKEIGPLRRATDVVLGAGRSAVNTIMNAPQKTYETLTSAMDSLTNPVSGQQEFNRDRQMTSEEVNIAMFNRLHPEAGSNKELYGGRDQTPLPTQVASATTPPAVVPPVVPTEPVMPTVPNFAAAQQYIGTPTVATPGFNFLMPFAPRPQVDFANLGQAYAPTALASAPPPQPLPGIPGAAYATPYQRLG